IQMKVQRTEEETAGKPEIDKIVQAEELAGVFAWSLEGLARMLARGRFLSSDSMADANEDFKAANNPVAAWVKVALAVDPFWMVDRRDCYASFKGWFSAEYGDNVTPPTPNFVTRAIKARLPVGDHKSDGYWMVVGIKMTEEGVLLRPERGPFGQKVGSGCLPENVNKARPGAR